MDRPKISIIILNWNGCQDTLACLSSLEKIHYPYFNVIVVDNGSKDDSIDQISLLHPKVKIISTGQNLGFAEGNNVGIRFALDDGANFLLLLNNDTIVDPGILDAYLSAFEAHPQAGILGAKIYLFEERDKFDHLGGTWNTKKGVFDLIGNRLIDDHIQWEEIKEIDYACGCALFISAKVFKEVGLLEPRYFLIWEESDFCFRARKKGFKTVTCPGARVWHKVSASFVGGKPHSTYFWWRNRLLWIERNCSISEKLYLAFLVLMPDIFHLFKLRILKSAQLQILRLLKPHENQKIRKERLMRYKAALHGVRDYLFRRFGNGPAWIYHKKSGL